MAKIFVGLSGGVDSATSAAILKQQGHDVVGVFIKIWSPEFLECTWREDRLDAMRAAVALNIPFKEIDLSREYRDTVVTDMIDSYQRGITPNPDVLCNRAIKFGAFSTWAFENGAEKIATGHYARIQQHGNIYSLLKGIDPAKDQSYFLYRLNQQDLSRALFPVGDLTKQEVRAYAKEFGLPVAQKPDSQGLCFVGDVTMRDFLSRFIPLANGQLLNDKDIVIGEHEGAALYTIGQRHGFLLNSNAAPGPYYVISIDTKNNIVRVSSDVSASFSMSTTLLNTHWIEPVRLPYTLDAVPRYHAAPSRATISTDGSHVEFVKATQVTPGQSLVFYDNNRCIGGATIGTLEIH